jgi:hypothetical protein
MFLSKLKAGWVVALVLALGAGGTGLLYRAAAADPGQTREATSKTRVALDDLEELRLEIEALRKGLHATRERVKSLESEVDGLKLQRAMMSQGSGGVFGLQGGGMLGNVGGALGLQGGMAPFGQPRGVTGTSSTFGGSGSGGFFGGSTGKGASTGGRGGTTFSSSAPANPLADAQKAIKELEQHPNSKEAVDLLERAVERLKKQSPPKQNPQ